MLILVIFGILLVVLVPQYWHYYSKDKAVSNYEQNLTGETITVTFSSSNLTSEKYETACSELENAGFTNISALPMNDLGLLEFGDNGSVYQVSIDGITSFSAGNKFAKDAIVTVRYHSMK